MNPRARTLELEHRVKAPRETVFRYFTDPGRHAGWIGTRAELDPRPGGIYRVQMDRGVAIVGEYVEIDPPRRLVFTWGWETERPLPLGADAVRAGSTKVEIDLIDEGGETIIRLRQSGFPSNADAESHGQGWKYAFHRMDVFAAGGTPGPYPAEFLERR